jgi:CheY-like chemotaxis protein
VLAKSDGEGKGAIFTVDLPIAFNAANNETNLTNPERGNNEQQLCEPVLNGLRVLIVDDEPDTRDMIYTFFKYCKAQVKAVATVNEVLSFIEESAPDVLISDISMPDIDGYDLIKKVRSFEVQKAIRIPVIGLTAHAGVVDRQTVLNSGFDLYMSKPIDLTALAQNVVSLAKK